MSIDVQYSNEETEEVCEVDSKPIEFRTMQKYVLKDFITEWEQMPDLWDKNHENYRNRHVKRKCFLKLLLILKRLNPEATLFDVKSKMNSLRSNYRKELRSLIANREAGISKPLSNSWVFYSLFFLGSDGLDIDLSSIQQPDHVDSKHIQTVDFTYTTDEEITRPIKFSPVIRDDVLKELILEWEKMPEIWDKHHEYFNKKDIRRKCLLKLLRIYRKINPYARIDDVKKKLNSLRSNFRKELRSILANREAGIEKPLPNSMTFQLLFFLGNEGIDIDLNSILNPGTIDNLSIDDNSMQTENCTDDEETDNSIEMVTPVKRSLYNAQTINPSPVKKNRCTRFKINIENLEATPQVLVWVNKLEKLSPTQRMFAEKAINDILFEAELGNLGRNSISINSCNPLGYSSPVEYKYTDCEQ